MEEQILNEEEKKYHEEVYRIINEIEEREHREVSFQEELKIRGAVTMQEFENLLKKQIVERGTKGNYKP